MFILVPKSRYNQEKEFNEIIDELNFTSCHFSQLNQSLSSRGFRKKFDDEKIIGCKYDLFKTKVFERTKEKNSNE